MRFFQMLIASTLGVLLAGFIIFIIVFITVVSSAEEPEPYIRDNTVLQIEISGTLPAHAATNPFDEILNPDKRQPVSLESLKANLEKAASHDKIKGVWLHINILASTWANLEEAHRLVKSFADSSDKFVYASTDDIGLNEAGYYLATAADSIFSPPETYFEFDGFYTQVTFLAGLFERIGIEAEVTRHGKYKSAVEPFYRRELSEESAYQLEELLVDVNSNFVEDVSSKTGKTAEELNRLLNSQPSLSAGVAFQNGLIDSLIYPDQVVSLIKERIGLDADKELNTVSNSRYSRVTAESAGINRPSTENKIAVIYASGPIMSSSNGQNPFDTQSYITAAEIKSHLDDIRDDSDIKALVVRINSPGGSGSTSDLIWRMLRETSRDVPVIASMGPVAASGGYYIAMAADTIVAESTTITGSIGVFGTKFNARNLFNEELGITFDLVKTHDHADWLVPTRGLTSSEEKAFQEFIDTFYNTFIGKVAESRGMTVEQVDQVAQGRVWTGVDAREQNLVDELGGIHDAIRIAAEKAGIESYRTTVYPRKKELFELLMSSTESRIKSWFSNPFLDQKELRQAYDGLSLKNRDALTLLPYEINIQ